MTLDDVKALSGRLFSAADLLLSEGFHNQAVARAYYAAYVVLDFWARRQRIYPWPQQSDGAALDHIPHKRSHKWFGYAFDQAGQVTTRAMQPPNVRQAALGLKEQRILADYRTHVEIPKEAAAKMVRNAQEIYSVVVVESGKVKDNPAFPED